MSISGGTLIRSGYKFEMRFISSPLNKISHTAGQMANRQWAAWIPEYHWRWKKKRAQQFFPLPTMWRTLICSVTEWHLLRTGKGLQTDAVRPVLPAYDRLSYSLLLLYQLYLCRLRSGHISCLPLRPALYTLSDIFWTDKGWQSEGIKCTNRRRLCRGHWHFRRNARHQHDFIGNQQHRPVPCRICPVPAVPQKTYHGGDHRNR